MRLHALAVGLMMSFAAAQASPAAEYPASTGYVNDFTGALPPAQRQALETRLRQYEKDTSNEVAIAIVPSLQGQDVDEYARGLFAAWRIGKRRQNNGVLFLWAPAERKVRIQVGYGLQTVLTDQAAAGIVKEVTGYFRNADYSQGVNAAVDGILRELGGASTQPGQPQSEPAPALPDTAPEPAAPSRSPWLAPLVLLVIGLGTALVAMKIRQSRRETLERQVPEDLARGGQLLDQLASESQQAVNQLEELKRQAPSPVWIDFEAPVKEAPGTLGVLRRDLSAISGMPRGEYGELREVRRSYEEWENRLRTATGVFADVGSTHRSFHDAKALAMPLFDSLAGAMAGAAQRVSEAGWSGESEQLLKAAQDTYAQAKAASAENQPNWLLIHDLLMDVQSCLERMNAVLSGESGWGGSTGFGRRWPGSQDASTAALTYLLMMQSWNNANAQSGAAMGRSSDTSVFGGFGGDSGSSSGGSDFGGGGGGGDFGGGDSGGGGASGSY